jgi:O-6-methylguanine DNA methyltransferase
MKARDEVKGRELRELMELLARERAAEKIPAPQSRQVVRARLLKSAAEESQMRIAVFETRLGWIGLAFDAESIVGLQLPRATRAEALRHLQREYPDATLAQSAPRAMTHELEEYARGERRVFDLPLNWSRIQPFQRAVLETANRIPYGETRTYGWIAREIGKPHAARAVGAALGANPIPIILPCHRVIGSDGGLHGYGGGLPLKRRLLELEGAFGK